MVKSLLLTTNPVLFDAVPLGLGFVVPRKKDRYFSIGLFFRQHLSFPSFFFALCVNILGIRPGYY